MVRYHQEYICDCNKYSVDLRVKHNEEYIFTVTNTGTAPLCKDYILCSKFIKKSNCEKYILLPGESMEIRHQGQRKRQMISMYFKIDNDNWIKSNTLLIYPGPDESGHLPPSSPGPSSGPGPLASLASLPTSPSSGQGSLPGPGSLASLPTGPSSGQGSLINETFIYHYVYANEYSEGTFRLILVNPNSFLIYNIVVDVVLEEGYWDVNDVDFYSNHYVTPLTGSKFHLSVLDSYHEQSITVKYNTLLNPPLIPKSPLRCNVLFSSDDLNLSYQKETRNTFVLRES